MRGGQVLREFRQQMGFNYGVELTLAEAEQYLAVR